MDEQLLTWSPDGDMILVTDTARCCYGAREESIHVLRLDGTLVASKRGTFARWSPDGTRIYYRDLADSPDQDPLVQVLDLATGKVTKLPIREPFRLAPSPDGRFLAYDDDGETPNISVFDLQSSKARSLGPGLAPLWLSDSTLAATRTRPCKSPDECVDARWHGLGKSIVYSLDGAAPHEITLGNTLYARTD
jgi:DNA-binding beta-propeller fold protein YncE